MRKGKREKVIAKDEEVNGQGSSKGGRGYPGPTRGTGVNKISGAT